MMHKRIFPIIAVVLIVLQVALILLSWLLAAAFPLEGFNSLLSGEGVRWAIGHFTNHVSVPLLSWILLASMAIGCLRRSGLGNVFFVIVTCRKKRSQLTYRERFAFQITFILFVIFIIILFLLTCIPQAVMLSATGKLWNSTFLSGFIPLLSIALCIFSLVYGYFSGKTPNLDMMFRSLYAGIVSAAPIIVLYMMAAELYFCILFVFV